MNNNIRVLAIAMSLVVYNTALAQTAPGAGILGTMHDFSSGTDPGNQYAATNVKPVGLCTFCHTPHSAQSTTLLWNHTMSSNTYTWGEATTTRGTPYPTNLNASYTGPSVKCLSCHDGSIAIGDVSAFRGAKAVANTYKIPTGIDQIGVGGSMEGNHPIGLPYPYGGTTNTYNGISENPAIFPYSDFVPNPEISTTAKIRLYQSDSHGKITVGAAAGISGIECSSCHDPHNKSAVDVCFLRGKEAGSTIADGNLCAQCHAK